MPLPDADEAITRILLGLLGTSERLERVWDAGQDHSEELAEVNARLVDLTSLLGNGPYKAGTPQRERLDATIQELADGQERLSALSGRPAGWTWKPTGETFKDWWDRQTVQEKNIYLRSMNVSIGFTYPLDRDVTKPKLNIELGNLEAMLGELRPIGSAGDLASTFDIMTAAGIRWAVINGESISIRR